MISALKDCANIYSGKSETAFEKAADLKVYEKPIFYYFERIEDECTRNEMMQEMLQAIIDFPQKLPQ